MKYCIRCGAQLEDDAVFCSICGAATGTGAPEQPGTPNYAPLRQQAETSSGLKLVAKIFMLLGCIGMGVWLIPLAWTIPMTVTYWKSVREHRPVSTGFKVCTLLFVSLVAGILMLCDDTPN